MKNPFLSRKFILSLVMTLFVTGLAYMGKLDVATLLDFLKWVLGLYLGANVPAGIKDAVAGPEAP